MGVIDDNDVIYINGTPVASSGFIGDPASLASGGFDYAGGVKWEKSYWEVEREYTIPASVLNQGGTNEIAIRLYNNNSYGGFYLGKNYALCGNSVAVRAVKGLPTEIVDDPALNELLLKQITAIENGDMDAYAATIWDEYHHDAADKAARVAEIQAIIEGAENVSVVDENADFYKDDQGTIWYAGKRTITGTVDGEEKALFSGEVEIAYGDVDGEVMEIGNWNRCYSTSYDSELLGRKATYSIYLPPSYYTDKEKTYPVVYLLHGQNSSSGSFLNVDHIGDFMDGLIGDGTVIEMIVVMPDSGKNAFYRDSGGGPDDNNGPWKTHITSDIVGMADATYRTIPSATMRGISGISMGGYGAMTIGSTTPGVFSSVATHMGWLPNDALEALKGLDIDQLGSTYDFYVDVGLQDTTVGTQGTINIHKYLDSIGKVHGFDLRDGGHNSGFYMAGMGASMKMHSDHFQGIISEIADYSLLEASAPVNVIPGEDLAEVCETSDGGDLTATFKAPITGLVSVTLDGEELTADTDYTLGEGDLLCTPITLPEAVLNEMAKGEHKLVLNFVSGKTAELSFTLSTRLTVVWLDAEDNELARIDYAEGQDEPAYPGEEPTKEGSAQYSYTFKGWDKGTVEETTTTYRPEFEETLNEYTVTFEVNGGSEVAAQTVPYGQKITQPDDPSRYGFLFDHWYADEALSEEFDFTVPVSGDVTVYAGWTAIEYTVVSGELIWTKGSSDGITVTVKRSPDDSVCFAHFTGVTLDGKQLTASDYEAKAGSTVVTVKPSVLQKLNTGSHNLTVTFNDGYAPTNLVVKAGTTGGGGGVGTPRTGDESNVVLWIGLLAISALAVGGVVFYLRKKRSAE